MTKTKGELAWKELEMASIIREPGSARQYETGDWKSQRPILDESKCNKCGLCYIFCPEGCIEEETDGYFIADLAYCKGCGICSVECPKKAITMVEEE